MEDQLSEILSKLAEISSQLEASEKSLKSYIPSLVGLGTICVAFVIGYWSRRVAEKQINASQKIAVQHIEGSNESAARQISANSRKEWLATLREKLSKFLALASSLDTSLRLSESVSSDVVDKLNELSVYIELMLNENEAEQSTLINQLQNFLSLCYKSKGKTSKKDIKKFIVNRNDIKKTARKILKAEWGKVKRME